MRTSARASMALSFPACARPNPLQGDDDQVLFGQLANGVCRPFAGVPGILDAPVGHLIGAERRRLVDRDASELELLRGAERRLEAPREDAGLEAVAGPVGELERLVDRADGGDGADRAEDLFAVDPQLGSGICDHRGPDQLAVRVAAGQHAGAGGTRLLDPGEDTFAGVELPSSRFTFFCGARSASFQPTVPEPVNVIALTRSSSIRTSPISEAGPTRTLSQPGGSPASVSSSASSRADNGV